MSIHRPIKFRDPHRSPYKPLAQRQNQIRSTISLLLWPEMQCSAESTKAANHPLPSAAAVGQVPSGERPPSHGRPAEDIKANLVHGPRALRLPRSGRNLNPILFCTKTSDCPSNNHTSAKQVLHLMEPRPWAIHSISVLRRCRACLRMPTIP